MPLFHHSHKHTASREEAPSTKLGELSLSSEPESISANEQQLQHQHSSAPSSILTNRHENSISSESGSYSRSDTLASTSSHGSTKKSSTHSLGLSKPFKHHTTSHSHSGKPSRGHSTSDSTTSSGWYLPSNLDPIALVELAISTTFTIPGPSMDELRSEILPQLFHVDGYAHRVNCRETNFAGMLEGAEMLRERFTVSARAGQAE